MIGGKLVKCIQWTRAVHNSTVNLAGKNWRVSQGLAPSGNEYGPLIDIPDWSYADGTPAPVQEREKRRRAKRKEFVTQAISLMEEMKESKKIHENILEDPAMKQKGEKQKLKPKVS